MQRFKDFYLNGSAKEKAPRTESILPQLWQRGIFENQAEITFVGGGGGLSVTRNFPPGAAELPGVYLEPGSAPERGLGGKALTSKSPATTGAPSPAERPASNLPLSQAKPAEIPQFHLTATFRPDLLYFPLCIFLGAALSPPQRKMLVSILKVAKGPELRSTNEELSVHVAQARSQHDISVAVCKSCSHSSTLFLDWSWHFGAGGKNSWLSSPIHLPVGIFEASNLLCCLQLCNRTLCNVNLQQTSQANACGAHPISGRKEKTRGVYTQLQHGGGISKLAPNKLIEVLRSSQGWKMELSKGYLCGVRGKTQIATQVRPVSFTGFTSKLGPGPSFEKSWTPVTVFLQN
ncbi:PREDICTED: uncharacterized protein LOC106901046 [Calidris pugnax]|uniref:uncharacterized protein LOC106901046 n=1 Tax=Calidris pugnax TaxID=198806 RepID=UPI00071CCA28|nr:PREDICTED: uncharacterized protein LOC106901046 [Calidris pugnax]